MVAFKDAFNLTTATIDRRTFHYRNLVILVVQSDGASAYVQKQPKVTVYRSSVR